MIKLNSSFEGEIVKFYDLYFLPKEKITKEGSYIIETCRCYLTNTDSCIDIGCGTGAYDELLADHFDKVTGLDMSRDMIDYANGNHKKGTITYVHKDARCKETFVDKSADLAVSLAHVVGYQLDNRSLEDYFLTVHMNLRSGGLFWFNFYNQPALFQTALSPRYFKIEENSLTINRISNASINGDDNCLDMDYYYIITRQDDSEIIEIHEKMRYFTKLEMAFYLDKCGFDVVKMFNYNTTNDLSSDNWNAGVLAKKR